MTGGLAGHARNRTGWTAWGRQAGLLDHSADKVPRRAPAPRLPAPAVPAQLQIFEVAA